MIEILTTYVLDEKGVTLATWVLSVVTALDAKVGVRIYTRMTVLIKLVSKALPTTAKVIEPEPEETKDPEQTPEPRPAKTLNDGHYFRA